MTVWSEPPGGFTPGQLRERRRLRIQRYGGLCLVAVIAASFSGYEWVTKVTPVARSHAVELFRTERSDLAAGRRERVLRAPARPNRDAGSRRVSQDASGVASRAPGVVRSKGSSAASRTADPDAGNARKDGVTPPREGVYSWATEGYEQVGSARRDFPQETQRIITHGENGTWTQHHYFSEERQIWTEFQRAPTGVEINEQRNKVTFGPVTRESNIDFDPPMLAAPRVLRVGYEWDGEWKGDTSGNYFGEIFEHTTMGIGGEQVEVWGMTYLIDLHGEQEGQVNARVWFAPDPGLTVKEHYVQDVESDGADYYAEWMQTLKSLRPRQ